LTVIWLAGTTATVQTQPNSKFIVNTAGATIGQLIQGTAGQTGDLLQVRNDINTVLLSVGSTGNTAIAGTLAVTGGIAGPLSVSGALTASSTLSVTGALTANSTLSVSGTSTLGTINTSGTLTATGQSIFKKSSNSTTAFRIQDSSSSNLFV